MIKKYLNFKENNILLINFDEIFKEIQINCLNDLDKFGFIKNYRLDLSKKDVKKLIYHYVIHGICEEIRLNKDNYKKILILPPKIRSFHEITNFCDIDTLQLLLDRLFKKLKSTLPFLIYTSNDYIFETDSEDSGEMIDLVNIINEKYNCLSNKSFTFEKIKKFTNKYDLMFLSKEYFNCLKTKLLLH